MLRYDLEPLASKSATRGLQAERRVSGDVALVDAGRGQVSFGDVRKQWMGNSEWDWTSWQQRPGCPKQIWPLSVPLLLRPTLSSLSRLLLSPEKTQKLFELFAGILQDMSVF